MTDALANFHRARRAEQALSAYRKSSGCAREDTLSDLLCDLMHLADAHSFSFEADLKRARDHHRAERIESLIRPAHLRNGKRKGVRTYRVMILERLSHRAIVYATDSQDAESVVLQLWAEHGPHQNFSFEDSDIDQVTVKEMLP